MTSVQEIKLIEDTEVVRKYDGVEIGLCVGMQAKDVKGLTPLQIQENLRHLNCLNL
ncbi:hypothetical protein ACFFIF_01310 [Vagococcus entomophilus]|uniref:hypothetical protein n=1 Tax=Vagococcus entomophilus TaxID=1160095 RepID=UPI00147344CD|nr:hypothetical protein [Vagococcus entomophilus]